MNIPLDRLYSYLGSLTNDNMIIYHWYPHGSKNLDDLTHWHNKKPEISWLEYMTHPSLIFHDQEPLNYHLYSVDQFEQRISDRGNIIWSKSPYVVNCVANSHLRSCLKIPVNCQQYTILCHSEKNSKDLELYKSNDFVDVYYWSHAIIAKDWFRFAESDAGLRPNFESINSDFLIYNRAWSGTREYRLKFSELLLSKNLLKQCNMRFNPIDDNLHYSDHKFANPNLKIKNFDFEQYFQLNDAPSHASADYDTSDYSSAAIEVILETLFDDTRNHLTEKTLRSIACGKPFMLAATPGSLQYLRDYGFETFDGLINESYDLITDPVERLSAIVSEMQRISNLSKDEKTKLWQELYSISMRNQKRFFSQEFFDYVINEFKHNLRTALDQCNQHITDRWWGIASDQQNYTHEIPRTENYRVMTAWLKNHFNQ